MERIEFELYTEYIQLNSLLKYEGIGGTGGEAGQIIKAGEVKVNGNVCTEVRKKIYKNYKVEVFDIIIEVVSK